MLENPLINNDYLFKYSTILVKNGFDVITDKEIRK